MDREQALNALNTEIRACTRVPGIGAGPTPFLVTGLWTR